MESAFGPLRLLSEVAGQPFEKTLGSAIWPLTRYNFRFPTGISESEPLNTCDDTSPEARRNSSVVLVLVYFVSTWHTGSNRPRDNLMTIFVAPYWAIDAS